MVGTGGNQPEVVERAVGQPGRRGGSCQGAADQDGIDAVKVPGIGQGGCRVIQRIAGCVGHGVPACCYPSVASRESQAGWRRQLWRGGLFAGRRALVAAGAGGDHPEVILRAINPPGNGGRGGRRRGAADRDGIDTVKVRSTGQA